MLCNPKCDLNINFSIFFYIFFYILYISVANVEVERIAIDAGTGNIYYTGIYAEPEDPEYPGFIGLVTRSGDQMTVRNYLIQPKDIVLYGLEG